MTYLDVWRSGTFLEKQRVHYRLQTWNVERLSTRHQTDLATFLGWILKAALQLYRRNVPLLHTSRYVIPRDSVSTASDKCWGEKAWVQRYTKVVPVTCLVLSLNTTYPLHTHWVSKLTHILYCICPTGWKHAI